MIAIQREKPRGPNGPRGFLAFTHVRFRKFSEGGGRHGCLFALRARRFPFCFLFFREFVPVQAGFSKERFQHVEDAIKAEIKAPRASSMQTSLMRYILETIATPTVAANMPSELVIIEASLVAPARTAASSRSLPFRISSWKRELTSIA